MSLPRLPFLYPHLFRSIRVCESATPKVRLRTLQDSQQYSQIGGGGARRRDFSTVETRKALQFVQRHGKAVEPFIPAGQSAEDMKVFTPEEEGKNEAKTNENVKAKNEEKSKSDVNPSSAAPLSEETQEAAFIPGDDGKETVYESVPIEDPPPHQQAVVNKSDPLNPLETVFRMPSPESPEEEDASKPPHLHTPPYVHHFDTYTLVQQVGAGGFTTEQSITAMKAVRSLLALNLDVAKAGLVSKSDVENVSDRQSR